MNTKHSPSCVRVFNRYDANCARCCELKAGSAPRAGWSDLKKIQDARRAAAVKAFFGPGGRFSQMTDTERTMCTAFEW